MAGGVFPRNAVISAVVDDVLDGGDATYDYPGRIVDLTVPQTTRRREGMTSVRCLRMAPRVISASPPTATQTGRSPLPLQAETEGVSPAELPSPPSTRLTVMPTRRH